MYLFTDIQFTAFRDQWSETLTKRNYKSIVDYAPKKSDVIDWYLNEISNEIESQEELLEKKTIVEKVLDKLIFSDMVIIPIKSSAPRYVVVL